ncbi:MAG: hypothetical protein ABEJ64_00030 [Candidatus Nanohaloarchaea archaeon]
MKKKLELLSGSTVFLLSVALLLFFRGGSTLLLVAVFAAQWTSILVLIGAVDRYLLEESVFDIGPRKLSELLLGSIIFHVGLVFYGGAAIRTMWYYPGLDFLVYAALAPVGYCLYGLALYGLYETVERELEPVPLENHLRGYYSSLMKLEIAAGVAGATVSTYYIIDLVFTHQIALGAIQQAPELQLPLWFFFLPWLSMFLLFDGLCYLSGKTTLTLKTINRDFSPVYAILIASAIGILMIEVVNSPVGLWEFVNWPYPDFKIFGLPGLVYAVWPLQLPALLAVIRLIMPEGERIW